MNIPETRILFSPQEVASLINRARTFVHMEIAAGHLRSFKHGRRCRRIHRDALLEYVANIQKSDGGTLDPPRTSTSAPLRGEETANV